MIRNKISQALLTISLQVAAHYAQKLHDAGASSLALQTEKANGYEYSQWRRTLRGGPKRATDAPSGGRPPAAPFGRVGFYPPPGSSQQELEEEIVARLHGVVK
jgi:hypothetical protein